MQSRKNRKELIEELDLVQYYIEIVEKQVNAKLEDNPYYMYFDRQREFEHIKEIRVKAYAYWKRRFNRIIRQLQY